MTWSEEGDEEFLKQRGVNMLDMDSAFIKRIMSATVPLHGYEKATKELIDILRIGSIPSTLPKKDERRRIRKNHLEFPKHLPRMIKKPESSLTFLANTLLERPSDNYSGMAFNSHRTVRFDHAARYTYGNPIRPGVYGPVLDPSVTVRAGGGTNTKPDFIAFFTQEAMLSGGWTSYGLLLADTFAKPTTANKISFMKPGTGSAADIRHNLAGEGACINEVREDKPLIEGTGNIEDTAHSKQVKYQAVKAGYAAVVANTRVEDEVSLDP